VSVPVALIAAVAENGVIGINGSIPWRLPSDFAFFKRTTMGKPLLMGRKTFESIGRPLPGRVNIVISAQPGYQPDGVLVFNSLVAALDRAQDIAKADGASEVMIGGGAGVYAEAMDLADRLYITNVALAPVGDTYFPEIEPSRWEVVAEPDVKPSERDSARFNIKVYERR
jgi:dihydrofolate reductase